MLVEELLVEGELDAQLLLAVCGGRPLVTPVKASKNSLAPRARTERQKRGRQCVFYLRDRDFDYEPPCLAVHPVELSTKDLELHGWHWCRHSIESYMLEPAIVCDALDVSKADYCAALLEAAGKIKFYQAARWAVGLARQALPPNYKLETGCGGSREFFVPEDDNLTKEATKNWVLGQVKRFLDQVTPQLNEESIAKSFEERVALFDSVVCKSTETILIYFSGKDLMTALKSLWLKIGIGGADDFRKRLRDWMITNPNKVLIALPEWQALLHTMRQ